MYSEKGCNVSTTHEYPAKFLDRPTQASLVMSGVGNMFRGCSDSCSSMHWLMCWSEVAEGWDTCSCKGLYTLRYCTTNNHYRCMDQGSQRTWRCNSVIPSNTACHPGPARARPLSWVAADGGVLPFPVFCLDAVACIYICGFETKFWPASMSVSGCSPNVLSLEPINSAAA